MHSAVMNSLSFDWLISDHMIKMAEETTPELSDASLYPLQEFLQKQISQDICKISEGGHNIEVFCVQEAWVGSLLGYMRSLQP